MGNQSRDRIAKLDLLIILAIGTYKHERGAQNSSAAAVIMFQSVWSAAFLKLGRASIRRRPDFETCTGLLRRFGKDQRRRLLRQPD